jgi:hypothetical protein
MHQSLGSAADPVRAMLFELRQSMQRSLNLESQTTAYFGIGFKKLSPAGNQRVYF